MKELHVADITDALYQLCQDANTDLPQDVYQALEKAKKEEASPFGEYALSQILANADLAKEQACPMCQDTGMAVVYLEIGQDLHITGGNLKEAVNLGVRRGYEDFFLRKSVVGDPLFGRNNTEDNTPAVIHMEIVPGDHLRMTLMPKGGGAENMGALAMLKPTASRAAVIDFVVDTVSRAGGNPCPPIIVGVGIGGTMEKATELAKEALQRDLGERNTNQDYACLEEDMLRKINQLGVGPQGLGGNVTALDVHIAYFPTHIAMLPVAVNLNCHAARHKTVILEGK